MIKDNIYSPEFKDGLLIARSEDDLKHARKHNLLYVFAICPKCKEGWTSLLANAKSILEKGCLSCADGEWESKIGVIIRKK